MELDADRTTDFFAHIHSYFHQTNYMPLHSEKQELRPLSDPYHRQFGGAIPDFILVPCPLVEVSQQMIVIEMDNDLFSVPVHSTRIRQAYGRTLPVPEGFSDA